MFFRILKKDLKRKKTMNIIMLLFIIISSMFAAASLNNIVAVTGGIDRYFEMAEVPDLIVSYSPKSSDFREKLEALPGVTEVKHTDALCVLGAKYFKMNGKRLDNFINPAFLISDSQMSLNYFDKDNNIIKSVDKGCFYCTAPFADGIDLNEGDIVDLEIGESKLSLKYMGCFKGATFSNDKLASPYLIINNADYEYFKNEPELNQWINSASYVNTTDTDAVIELAKEYDDVSVETREEKKGMYLYDMMLAYILMVICIVLLFIAFVVLRFTIGFTINEEIREIGVMKAIGIGNRKIRSIYIVKYLAIAVVGSFVGFIFSFPLSDLMMQSISSNIIFDSKSNNIVGLISSAAVVLIILLFCYTCTRKVKKLSPIDAVRNGETGERFHKKSIMHLGSTRLSPTGFLAANDIVSAPKRFGIITLIFTLCILMVTMLSNFYMTLTNDKVLWLFDVPESDAHIADISYYSSILKDFGSYKTILADTDKMLAENDMPGKSSMLIGSAYDAYFNGKKANEWFFVTKGADDYKLKCSEGSAPQKIDEVAMTGYAMDDLGASIGDRIKAVIGDKEYEFIITGKYSTFEASGHAIKLHPDFELATQESLGTFGIQIKFDGDPDKATINNNIEKLKTLIESDKVYSSPEVVKVATGVSDMLLLLKKVMTIMTVVVTALIVILMERSFISKEKSEIALMKAIGIKNTSIIAQHTIRFIIISVIACIISTALLMPLSNAIMNWVCGMMGDVSGVKCAFDPLDIFVFAPCLLIAVTAIGAFLTALYTKSIKASDASCIE